VKQPVRALVNAGLKLVAIQKAVTDEAHGTNFQLLFPSLGNAEVFIAELKVILSRVSLLPIEREFEGRPVPEPEFGIFAGSKGLVGRQTLSDPQARRVGPEDELLYALEIAASGFKSQPEASGQFGAASYLSRSKEGEVAEKVFITDNLRVVRPILQKAVT